MAFNSCTGLSSVSFAGTIDSAGFGNSAFTTIGDLRVKFYATDKDKGTPGTYTASAPVNNKSTWTLAGSAAAPAVTPAAPAAANPVAVQPGDPESDFQVTRSGGTITITGYKGNKSTVTIPSHIQNFPVAEIGSTAFYEKSGVTSVIIPNTVTTIGMQAFFGCTSLTNVTIGSGITKFGIEAAVFLDCTNLTSVTFIGAIPSASINYVAFQGLGDLRAKFYATDKTNGTPGTYTRPNGTSTTWTKK